MGSKLGLTQTVQVVSMELVTMMDGLSWFHDRLVNGAGLLAGLGGLAGFEEGTAFV